MIAIAQLAAFAYGLSIVYLARPAFIVFAVDQFQIAAAVDLAPEELARAKLPQFRKAPLTGPRFAYAELPRDPKERTEFVLAGVSGKDLEHFPRLYVPYEERTAQVLAKAWPLEKARKLEPDAARIVDAYVAQAGLREDDVRYVRLRARKAWLAVLIDAKTAAVRKMLITEKID